MKNMPSNKRLNSVCHSIAHHAVSALSYIHPHLRQACNSSRMSCALIDLNTNEPCPDVFKHIEPLQLSLSALRKKFITILTAEGFNLSDIKSIYLMFYFTDEFPDDYCSICDAEIMSVNGKKYLYVVDYMGNTREPDNELYSDCIQRWSALIKQN